MGVGLAKITENMRLPVCSAEKYESGNRRVMDSGRLRHLPVTTCGLVSAVAFTLAASNAFAQQASTQSATSAQAQTSTTQGSNASGAQTSQSGNADLSLDTITVTATKTSQSVVDVMAGASVITADQIKQQQPGSIADMLQNVPGVASEVTPNDPGQSINIRGMQDFGRVNVLIDGARQDYQVSGHNANGTFYLDPLFVGQANVVRGPVANIYGSGAIGGEVSFQTMGVDDILKPEEKYGVAQRLILGNNGGGIETSTSAGYRYGTIADVYGQFLYRNSWSYMDGQGNTIPDTGSDVLGGLFKLNLRPGEGQQISLTALNQKDEFDNDGTSNSGARFANRVNTGTYTLGYTYKAPWTSLIDLDSKIYYSTTQNRQTYLAADPDQIYPALGVVAGDQTSDRINTDGFDIHNTSRFASGPLVHALTLGGDGTQNRVTTTDNAGGFVSVLTPSGDRSLYGAFVQDEVAYNGWLRVLGALRYDGYNLSGGGTSSSGDHLSPKITVGVTPIKGVEFYGTYAEGYRAPSITETLISGVHPFPSFTFLPNPDLVAETAHNFEAGVNVKYDSILRPGDSIRAKGTAFLNNVDDFIDLAQVGDPILTSFVPGIPNSACPFLPPGLCMPFQPFQYVNVAKARLSGVEFEGAYDWGQGFVSLEGSATNGKNLDDGMSLATVPPYRASATVAFRFLDNNALTLGARFTVVGAAPKNVPTSETITPSSGYGLVGLFASYSYNDYVSGTFTIDNLFNHQYTQFLSSEANPGTVIKLGLNIKFAAR
jgi:hemoglobin/transferrin/lactoferrin receptor protein